MSKAGSAGAFGVDSMERKWESFCPREEITVPAGHNQPNMLNSVRHKKAGIGKKHLKAEYGTCGGAGFERCLQGIRSAEALSNVSWVCLS